MDDSGGVQRYENRAGISLAMFNDLAGWLQEKGAASLSHALATARAAERQARRQTLKARAIEAGRGPCQAEGAGGEALVEAGAA